MTAALRLATEAEKRVRDEVTFAEWGTRLTLPQYLEREQLLRAHPWARAGMETWFLAEGDEVLSSCETFRNDSHVSGVAGESYAIASVFTEEKHRGKGHAHRLMVDLQAELKKRSTAQGLVLFSDVGAKLYERSGFRAEPAFDWLFPPIAQSAGSDGPSIPLSMVGAPPRVTAAPNSLVLQPSAEQLDWHHHRSRLYARLLSLPPLQQYGAQTQAGTAWWTAQFKSNELLVLWLDAPDAEAAAALIRVAQVEAHRAGLPKVRVWETMPLIGGERVPRDGELPMSVPLNATFTHWLRVDRALWV